MSWELRFSTTSCTGAWKRDRIRPSDEHGYWLAPAKVYRSGRGPAGAVPMGSRYGELAAPPAVPNGRSGVVRTVGDGPALVASPDGDGVGDGDRVGDGDAVGDEVG